MGRAYSLSGTAKEAFRKPFLPMIPGFRHVHFGDIEMMRKTMEACALVGEEVAGVIGEQIQGEVASFCRLMAI